MSHDNIRSNGYRKRKRGNRNQAHEVGNRNATLDLPYGHRVVFLRYKNDF